MKTIAMLFCALLVGCMDNGIKPADNTQPAPTGKIAFALSKTSIPQDIASLTFTLTNLSTSETVSKTLIVSSDTLMQVEFDQLAVGAWHVKVVAKDSTSGKKYAGESDANVIEGQVTQLSLSLNTITTGGALVITVTWPGTAPFVDYAYNPVLSKTGKWYDIVGVSYPAFVYENGKYKMWFMNYGRIKGVPYGTVGLAESVDGTSWTRICDTVMFPTPNAWDAGTVCPGTVLHENGVYTMYYTGARPNGVGYNIGRATSQDGISWTKDTTTIIPGKLNMALGTVLKVNNMYYLYYNTAPAYAIHLATSTDGFNWQVYAGNPILTPTLPWEGDDIFYPSVIYENNTFTMIYSNNNFTSDFALATSTDGIHWTKDSRNPVFSKSLTVNNWTPYSIGYPRLLRVGNELRMYYTGYQSDGSERIGYAIKR